MSKTHDDAWYFEKAKRELQKDGEIEFDSPQIEGNYGFRYQCVHSSCGCVSCATVSNGDDRGAYVKAWVWVEDDPDDPWDEEQLS